MDTNLLFSHGVGNLFPVKTLSLQSGKIKAFSRMCMRCGRRGRKSCRPAALDPWQRKLSAQYITKQSTYTSAAARTSSTTGNDNVVSGGSYIRTLSLLLQASNREG